MNINGKVTGIIVSLAALAVSGIAFAKHEEGHDKRQGPGPKESVNVTNTCELHVDVDYVPCTETECRPDHILLVKTEIADASDDPADGFTLTSKTVKGFQRIKDPTKKGKKPMWKPAGLDYDSKDKPNDSIPGTVEIHLCEGDMVLSDNAKALNAEVTVEVGGRVFYSRCDDDPDTFCDYDENGEIIICEEKDESIVLPVDDYGDRITCAAQ